jgi:hypothetical protein
MIMLAPGFTYQVDQVGAITIIPILDKKAGCYCTLQEWRAKRKAGERRFAAIGTRIASKRCVTLCASNGILLQGTKVGAFPTWEDVVKNFIAVVLGGDISRAVWFDDDLRPTVFRVQNGKVEITMTAEECLAAAKQRIEDSK